MICNQGKLWKKPLFSLETEKTWKGGLSSCDEVTLWVKALREGGDDAVHKSRTGKLGPHHIQEGVPNAAEGARLDWG